MIHENVMSKPEQWCGENLPSTNAQPLTNMKDGKGKWERAKSEEGSVVLASYLRQNLTAFQFTQTNWDHMAYNGIYHSQVNGITNIASSLRVLIIVYTISFKY